MSCREAASALHLASCPTWLVRCLMSCREVDSALHLASCPIWLVSWREGGSLGLAPGLLFYLADELEGGSLGPAPILVPLLNLAEDPLLLSHHQVLVI